MTKDKLKELFAVECTETDGKGVTVIKGTPMDIINWINDKLDQETQRIKAELAYKDKEIEISHNENRRMERHFLETVTVINSLRELQTEDLKQLQSELTELKEKHKRDVMAAYGEGWQEGIYNPKRMTINLEQYYNETHKTK